MNLELIQEINSLKENNTSYTEIAEITGIAKTSIVLSIRLSKIFNTSNSQQISLLNQDIELLNSTISKYKDNFAHQANEIKKLNALINIDYNCDILVNKDEFKNLNDELDDKKNKVDMLNRKLRYKEQYLKNLSFMEKMNILFS